MSKCVGLSANEKQKRENENASYAYSFVYVATNCSKNILHMPRSVFFAFNQCLCILYQTYVAKFGFLTSAILFSDIGECSFFHRYLQFIGRYFEVETECSVYSSTTIWFLLLPQFYIWKEEHVERNLYITLI